MKLIRSPWIVFLTHECLMFSCLLYPVCFFYILIAPSFTLSLYFNPVSLTSLLYESSKLQMLLIIYPTAYIFFSDIFLLFSCFHWKLISFFFFLMGFIWFVVCSAVSVKLSTSWYYKKIKWLKIWRFLTLYSTLSPWRRKLY